MNALEKAEKFYKKEAEKEQEYRIQLLTQHLIELYKEAKRVDHLSPNIITENIVEKIADALKLLSDPIGDDDEEDIFPKENDEDED